MAERERHLIEAFAAIGVPIANDKMGDDHGDASLTGDRAREDCNVASYFDIRQVTVSPICEILDDPQRDFAHRFVKMIPRLPAQCGVFSKNTINKVDQYFFNNTHFFYPLEHSVMRKAPIRKWRIMAAMGGCDEKISERDPYATRCASKLSERVFVASGLRIEGAAIRP